MTALRATVPDAVLELARSAGHVVVLTGAGMSAESGVPTFRDAQTGLWERFDPSVLATPQAWEDDPDLVWAWYAWRAALVGRARPNAGHLALARWADETRTRVTVATQNVDDLHERAGSAVLAHVHGSLFAPRCEDCSEPAPDALPALAEPAERLAPPRCVRCGARVRPGVVWFGEMLPRDAYDRAEDACVEADLVLVVGTSGLVHPAAGLPLVARAHGVPTVEVNPHESELSDQVHHVWRATAAQALPALVDALTAP